MNRRNLTFEIIDKVLLRHFNKSLEYINKKTNKREIVQKRQTMMFFASEFTKESLASIGFHYGKKDHATVLHAKKTINNLIDTDKSFKEEYQSIHKTLSIISENRQQLSTMEIKDIIRKAVFEFLLNKYNLSKKLEQENKYLNEKINELKSIF